jgi:hypothetical protein
LFLRIRDIPPYTSALSSFPILSSCWLSTFVYNPPPARAEDSEGCGPHRPFYTMQHSKEAEAWSGRDPREHDIQINVQPPGIWQPAAGSDYSHDNYAHQNAFEFDVRRDPRQYSWDGSVTPNDGWSTPNGRMTPSNGAVTPTALLPQRPALGMVPPMRYETYRGSQQSYSDSNVSSTVGSPGPQWQRDSRMGSQVNLLRYGSPTPPVSTLNSEICWRQGTEFQC